QPHVFDPYGNLAVECGGSAIRDRHIEKSAEALVRLGQKRICQLLNKADVSAICTVPPARRPAGNRQGFPFPVLAHIGRLRRVVPDTELVGASQLAIAESRLPSNLERKEGPGRPRWLTGIKSMCSSKVSRIYFIGRDLGVSEARNLRF